MASSCDVSKMLAESVEVLNEEVRKLEIDASKSLMCFPHEVLLHLLSFLDSNTLNKMRLMCQSMNVMCGEVQRKRIEQLIEKIEAKFEGYKYTRGFRGCVDLADIKNRLFRLTVSNLNFVSDMLEKPVEDINCRFDAGKVIQEAMDFFKTVEDLEDHPGANAYSIIPESFKRLKKMLQFCLYGNLEYDWEILEYFLDKKLEDFGLQVEELNAVGEDEIDIEAELAKCENEYLSEMLMEKGHFTNEDQYLEYLLRNSDI